MAYGVGAVDGVDGVVPPIVATTSVALEIGATASAAPIEAASLRSTYLSILTAIDYPLLQSGERSTN